MMYSFFGQNIEINLKNSAYKKRLLKELTPYISKEKTKQITITDNWNDFNHKPLANNPKQHYYYKNVIHIKEKLTEIAFVFNGQAEITHVYFKLIVAPNTFRKIIRKWLNMQFTNRVENIGQIFHENILIPLSFFIKDVAPIHASGFQYQNKTYLLGGTGGVGKTTLELLFCLKKNAAFITDDIAIINKKSAVYPNYNYPKIYGYNLIENKELKKKLFKNSGLLNKIHWFLHQKLFGIQKVRRKISPFKLFSSVVKNTCTLTDYLILFKSETNTITQEKMAIKNTVKASISVILTEYAYFFNQLQWHEFNATVLGENPIYTVSFLEEKWTKIVETALQNSNNNVVKIPFTISHQTYQMEMEKLLTDRI